MIHVRLNPKSSKWYCGNTIKKRKKKKAARCHKSRASGRRYHPYLVRNKCSDVTGVAEGAWTHSFKLCRNCLLKLTLSQSPTMKMMFVKTRIFSDSALNLGAINSDPSRIFQLISRKKINFAGEGTQLVWHIQGGANTLHLVNDIRQTLDDVESEDFSDRILFMSMFNDIEWIRKGIKEKFQQLLSCQRVLLIFFLWTLCSMHLERGTTDTSCSMFLGVNGIRLRNSC